ncbi:MAG: hypothetical protein FJ029_13225, partial [Actinobacteria bacterium]|nr:hypothetical protein [Actinomycetota bacterium]
MGTEEPARSPAYVYVYPKSAALATGIRFGERGVLRRRGFGWVLLRVVVLRLLAVGRQFEDRRFVGFLDLMQALLQVGLEFRRENWFSAGGPAGSA